MRNRYGDEYHWEKLNENEYRFVMTGKSLEYGRVGGKEGQDGIDMSDLGFFDPSGGPFIGIGSIVEDKTVSHIHHDGEYYIVSVE